MWAKYEGPKAGQVKRNEGLVTPSRQGTHIGDSVIATISYAPERGVRVLVAPDGAFRSNRIPVGERFIPGVSNREVTRSVWDGSKWVSEVQFRANNPSKGMIKAVKLNPVKSTRLEARRFGECAEGSSRAIRNPARGIFGNR